MLVRPSNKNLNKKLNAPPPPPSYYLLYVGHNNYLLSHNRPIYLLIDLLWLNSNFNIISSILWWSDRSIHKNVPITEKYNQESKCELIWLHNYMYGPFWLQYVRNVFILINLMYWWYCCKYTKHWFHFTWHAVFEVAFLGFLIHPLNISDDLNINI
jgi:hypothetical protein